LHVLRNKIILPCPSSLPPSPRLPPRTGNCDSGIETRSANALDFLLVLLERQTCLRIQIFRLIFLHAVATGAAFWHSVAQLSRHFRLVSNVAFCATQLEIFIGRFGDLVTSMVLVIILPFQRSKVC